VLFRSMWGPSLPLTVFERADLVDPALVTNAAALKLLHWDDTLPTPDWVDCTVSVDPVNHTITGQVNHLSPFLPAEPTGPPAPIPDASEWALIILALGGAAIVAREGHRRWAAMIPSAEA